MMTLRTATRLLVVLLILMIIGAGFQLNVWDRRSEQTWANWQQELIGKGERLDWQAFIPPPVPDEENFFEAPEVAAWFSRKDLQSELPVFVLPSFAITPMLLDELRAAPEEYLNELRAWFNRANASYQALAEAAARPSARWNGDYSNPLALEDPHFVNLRKAAQALATHANLSILDGDIDAGVQDLFVLKRLGEASGSVPTLVSSMIHVAIMGLYVEIALDAVTAGECSDEQLAAIQRQVEDVNLIEVFTRVTRAERAAMVHLGNSSPEQLREFQRRVHQLQSTRITPAVLSLAFWRVNWGEWLRDYRFRSKLTSRSWLFANLPAVLQVHQAILEQIPTNRRMHSSGLEDAFRQFQALLARGALQAELAAFLVPNRFKAAFTVGRRQTQLDQLLVACALERYRLRHAVYPERLEALIPVFVERIPNDLFNGQALQFQHIPDGGYKLWSIGWDETNDHGTPIRDPDGQPVFQPGSGDWILEAPPKRTGARTVRPQ